MKDCTHEHMLASNTLYMYSLLSITSLQIILCKGNTILLIKQIFYNETCRCFLYSTDHICIV